MPRRMRWEDIEKKYPEEWVLVIDYAMDEYGEVTDGILLRHSPNKEDVFSYPTDAPRIGLWYTGESPFRGLRSHAEHHAL